MSKSLMINNQAHEPIYEIVFETAFEKLAEKVKQIGLEGRKVCIVMDSNTSHLYGEMVRKVLEPVSAKVISFQFPAGELHKTLDVVRDIYKELIEAHFDRKDYLAALGGGVVGDITGFAAATYLRGISFIQIPTTLLAQVDSSVGGKVAVNTNFGKNLLGTFYQPKLVLSDISTFSTLNLRNLKTGLAEVIKYAFIQNSINTPSGNNLIFFEYLKQNKNNIYNLDKKTLIDVVKTCCCLKRDVVVQDEKEKGLRAILNFGHTFGHAIEKLTNYKKFTHGEAIVYGMKFALKLSYHLGMISSEYLTNSFDLINGYNLINKKLPNFKFDNIIKTMKLDKKVEHNKLRFILNNENYMVSIVNDIDINDIKNAL